MEIIRVCTQLIKHTGRPEVGFTTVIMMFKRTNNSASNGGKFTLSKFIMYYNSQDYKSLLTNISSSRELFSWTSSLGLCSVLKALVQP